MFVHLELKREGFNVTKVPGKVERKGRIWLRTLLLCGCSVRKVGLACYRGKEARGSAG